MFGAESQYMLEIGSGICMFGAESQYMVNFFGGGFHLMRKRVGCSAKYDRGFWIPVLKENVF